LIFGFFEILGFLSSNWSIYQFLIELIIVLPLEKSILFPSNQLSQFIAEPDQAPPIELMLFLSISRFHFIETTFPIEVFLNFAEYINVYCSYYGGYQQF